MNALNEETGQGSDEALRFAHKLHREFVADLPLGVVITQNGLIKFSNQLLQQMIGYSAEELLGRPFLPFMHESDRQRVMELHQRRMRGEDVPPGYECRMVTKTGEVRIWQIDARSTDWGGTAAVGLVTDITDRRYEEDKAHRAQQDLQMQIERMPIGMIVWDKDFRAQSWNPAAERIFGFSAQEAIGKHPYDLIVPASAKPAVDEIWHRLLQGDLTAFSRNENITRDGRTILCEWTNTPLKDALGIPIGALAMVQDVTESKIAENRIHELAYFDQLTGLPNRTLLYDRINHTLTASHRSGQYGALLLVDLDHFKTLNDTRGHDAGDRLLKQVAARLKQCVREADTVARLGGDEFVAMLSDLGRAEQDATRHASSVASKILELLSNLYAIDGYSHYITASIGVVLCKGHASTVDDLMKQADLAMYEAKASGRNAVRFFDPDMQAVVLERAALEDELRHAIKQEQFTLHYQPQVTADDTLTGAEVLLRWQHPLHGAVSPAEFIPLAEESALILPLGRWVLTTACAQLASWAKDPQMAHLTLAVNVSIHQFRQADFVSEVLAILRETGANPKRLKLEITESVMVHDVPDVTEKMLALKAHGVAFSLDDFGTGYSSLSYLKKLPLSELKIDREFVRDVFTDANDAAIARTIVGLAQSLGFGVIAEGVETIEQREFLANAGCFAYQGYLYSAPLPLQEFEQFARGNR
jgi:diguanylate cyclase (GGDEF)-like protein/PAS domain S-box-containing protein